MASHPAPMRAAATAWQSKTRAARAKTNAPIFGPGGPGTATVSGDHRASVETATSAWSAPDPPSRAPTSSRAPREMTPSGSTRTPWTWSTSAPPTACQESATTATGKSGPASAQGETSTRHATSPQTQPAATTTPRSPQPVPSFSLRSARPQPAAAAHGTTAHIHPTQARPDSGAPPNSSGSTSRAATTPTTVVPSTIANAPSCNLRNATGSLLAHLGPIC